jgi:hypothetical protein
MPIHILVSTVAIGVAGATVIGPIIAGIDTDTVVAMVTGIEAVTRTVTVVATPMATAARTEIGVPTQVGAGMRVEVDTPVVMVVPADSRVAEASAEVM